MKILLALLALTFASCSHNVLVVDQNGTPIKGAEIRPQTRSFNFNPITTNGKGTAYIRQDHPPIETLYVRSHGYQSPPPVNFNLPKPITVVLKK